jgi:peptidoglycan/LPS O-acetylase OafA/YrhL
MFFIMSGLFVTASWQKRRSVISYSVSRVMRVLPGLLLVVLVTTLIIGPLVTKSSLSDYFTASETGRYFIFTLLLQPDMTLPGVFTDLPMANEVNIPLWTLRYDFILYTAVLIAGVTGLLQKGRLLEVLSIAFIALYFIATFFTDLREIAFINHLAHFSYAFLIGVLFYIYQDCIRLLLWPGLVGVLLASLLMWQWGYMAGEALMIPATGFVGAWIGFVPGGPLRFYNLFGDYSYGLYIWHYPLLQTIKQFMGDIGSTDLFFLALPVALGAAMISWHFVERPSLSSVKHINMFIKRWAASRESYSDEAMPASQRGPK